MVGIALLQLKVVLLGVTVLGARAVAGQHMVRVVGAVGAALELCEVEVRDENWGLVVADGGSATLTTTGASSGAALAVDGYTDASAGCAQAAAVAGVQATWEASFSYEGSGALEDGTVVVLGAGLDGVVVSMDGVALTDGRAERGHWELEKGPGRGYGFGSGSLGVVPMPPQLYGFLQSFAMVYSGLLTTWGSGGFSDPARDSSSVTQDVIDGGGVRVGGVFYIYPVAIAELNNGSFVAWGFWQSVDVNVDPLLAALPGSGGIRELCRGNAQFSDKRSAILKDGTVVGFGSAQIGGVPSSMPDMGGSQVDAVFCNEAANAALLSTGQVLTWGGNGDLYVGNYGGDSSAVASLLASGVVDIASTSGAFAALKADGTVVVWGGPLQRNGFTRTVGEDPGSVTLTGVQKVVGNSRSFTVIYATSGSVACWGNRLFHLNCGVGVDAGGGAVDMWATYFSTSVLLANGAVLCFGSEHCENAGTVDTFAGVADVVTSFYAFLMLLEDGTIQCWGRPDHGGDCAGAADVAARGGAQHVAASQYDFAVVCADGSIVTWGNYGGDPQIGPRPQSAKLLFSPAINADTRAPLAQSEPVCLSDAVVFGDVCPCYTLPLVLDIVDEDAYVGDNVIANGTDPLTNATVLVECVPAAAEELWQLHVVSRERCSAGNVDDTLTDEEVALLPSVLVATATALESCWYDTIDVDSGDDWDGDQAGVAGELVALIEATEAEPDVGLQYALEVLVAFAPGYTSFNVIPLSGSDAAFATVNLPAAENVARLCTFAPCPCGQARTSSAIGSCAAVADDDVLLETYAAYARCSLLSDRDLVTLSLVPREVFLTHVLYCLKTLPTATEGQTEGVLAAAVELRDVAGAVADVTNSNSSGLYGLRKSTASFATVLARGGVRPTLTVPPYGVDFYTQRLDDLAGPAGALTNVKDDLQAAAYQLDLQQDISGVQTSVSALADLVTVGTARTLGVLRDNALAAMDVAVAEEDMHGETMVRLFDMAASAMERVQTHTSALMNSFDSLANSTFGMIELRAEIAELQATIERVRKEMVKGILQLVVGIVAIALTVATFGTAAPALAAAAVVIGASFAIDPLVESTGRRLLLQVEQQQVEQQQEEEEARRELQFFENVSVGQGACGFVGAVDVVGGLSIKAYEVLQRRCQAKYDNTYEVRFGPMQGEALPKPPRGPVSHNVLVGEAAFLVAGGVCLGAEFGGLLDRRELDDTTPVDALLVAQQQQQQQENESLDVVARDLSASSCGCSACDKIKRSAKKLQNPKKASKPPSRWSKLKAKAGSFKRLSSVAGKASKFAAAGAKVLGPIGAAFAVYEAGAALLNLVGAGATDWGAIEADKKDRERIQETFQAENEEARIDFKRLGDAMQEVAGAVESLSRKLLYVVAGMPFPDEFEDEGSYDASKQSPVLWDSLYHELMDVLVLDTTLCPRLSTATNELARRQRRLQDATSHSPGRALSELMEQRRAPLSHVGGVAALPFRRSLGQKPGERIEELQEQIAALEEDHAELRGVRDRACIDFKSDLRQLTFWAKGMHEAVLEMVETQQKLDFAKEKQLIWAERGVGIQEEMVATFQLRQDLFGVLPNPEAPEMNDMRLAVSEMATQQQLMDLADVSTSVLQDYCNVMSYVNPGSVGDMSECRLEELEVDAVDAVTAIQERLASLKDGRFQGWVDLVYSGVGFSADRALDISDQLDLDFLKAGAFNSSFVFNLAGPGGTTSLREGSDDADDTDAVLRSGPWFCDLDNVELESLGIVFLDDEQNILAGNVDDPVEMTITLSGPFVKTLDGERYSYEMRPYEGIPFSYSRPDSSGNCAGSERPWFYGQICHGNIQYAQDARVLRPSPYAQWSVKVVKGHHHLAFATTAVLFADVVGKYNLGVGCHPHELSIKLPDLGGNAGRAVQATFATLDVTAAMASVPAQPDDDGVLELSFGLSGPAYAIAAAQEAAGGDLGAELGGEVTNSSGGVDGIVTDGVANVTAITSRSDLYFCHADFVEMTSFGLVFLDAQGDVIFPDDGKDLVIEMTLSGPFLRTFKDETFVFEAKPYEGVVFSYYAPGPNKACAGVSNTHWYLDQACKGLSFNPDQLTRRLPSPYAQWTVRVVQGAAEVAARMDKAVLVASYHAYGNADMPCNDAQAARLQRAAGVEDPVSGMGIGGAAGLAVAAVAAAAVTVGLVVRRRRRNRSSRQDVFMPDSKLGRISSKNPVFSVVDDDDAGVIEAVKADEV